MTDSQNPTKAAFLAAYRDELIRVHEWARDPDRLERFFGIVRTYVTTNRNAWEWNTTTTRAAWRACGCSGRITFKALCALPAGE